MEGKEDAALTTTKVRRALDKLVATESLDGALVAQAPLPEHTRALETD